MKPNDFSDAQVLVTGGAGFIGSALVWALNRRGCERIVVCDRLGTDESGAISRRCASPITSRPTICSHGCKAAHWANLTSCCTWAPLIHDRDQRQFSHPQQLRIHQGPRHLGARKKTRFVYASSAATYGDGSAGMDDDDGKLDELRPLNMYGYSKQLFDLYAKRAGFLSQMVVLKYFNVFGPNEGHKGDMRSLVHKSFGQVQAEGVVRLFKSYRSDYRDGEQKRDFLYVKDAVAMTLHLAVSKKAGGLFNIGSGKARTWLDLARAVFAALKRKPKIEFIEMPEAIRDKYQYFTQANLSRLRAAGYTAPVTPLEDAVSDYVRNYLMADKRLDPAVG